KTGRGRQNHDVDVFEGDQILVGVEAGEAAVVSDVDLVAEPILKEFPAIFEVIGEQIGHGVELHAGAGLETVFSGAASAAAAFALAAATDQAHAQHVAAGGVNGGGSEATSDRSADSRRRGCLEKVAAGSLRTRVWSL